MWNPTHVQVIVQKAKELLVKGKGGTNDAYVVVQLGKERYMTTIKEKCKNPIWCEECDLAYTKKTQCIEIIVYHRNFFGIDEFLGQISIPLENFDANTSPKTKWYLLEGKKDKKSSKYRGKLEVTVSLVVNGSGIGGSTLNLNAKEKKGMRLKQLMSRATQIKLPHIPKRSFSLKADSLNLPQHIQQWRDRRLSEINPTKNESDDEEFQLAAPITPDVKPCETAGTALVEPEVLLRKDNQRPIQRPFSMTNSTPDVSVTTSDKMSCRQMSTPPENWTQIIVNNSTKETRRNTLQFSNDLNSSFQYLLGNSNSISQLDINSDTLSDVEGASKDELDMYKAMSKKQLVELIITQQLLLTRQKDKIRDLEKYIDDLLVRVMDISPRILHIAYKNSSPECVR